MTLADTLNRFSRTKNKDTIDLDVNTSLNKFQAWHIDGATNKKNLYESTNLQMAWVKIWVQTDY